MECGDPFEQCGPYRVLRQIGSGGMGSIFEAVDTLLGHRVALKRLHPHVASRPGATLRFLREGRAAARIRHPHVVQVLSLGEHDGRPYLAMELLEGCDLAARLAGGQPLPLQQALELIFPVIAAVAAAHDARVIHRDLKPSNVFVARGPAGKPWPKVLDFGVSKVLGTDGESAPTEADVMLGTAAYMAPEQARSVRNASFQSDQYSLAVILYQCLTGRVPFSAANDFELMMAIQSAPIAPPSQRVSALPPALDGALLRALHRKPELRFPSVRAFGASLFPYALERDRLAWTAEFDVHDSVVDTAANVTAVAVGPATMPPTARDTRAAAEIKRRASRGRGLLGAGTALAAAGLAVFVFALGPQRATAPVAQSVRQNSGDRVTPARADRADSIVLPAVSDERGPQVDIPRAKATFVDAPPAPASAPSSPVVRRSPRPRTTVAPTERTALPSVSSATSAAVAPPVPATVSTLGDNGAPILP